MADSSTTPNKGNGKGAILGPGNKPISEADRIKYNAVDKKQTLMLRDSNAKNAKKQAAVKEAVALAKAPKKTAAKPAAKQAAAKPMAKKAAPKKTK